MNRSLFSITRYMNRVCFKVSGGTSNPPTPPRRSYNQLLGYCEADQRLCFRYTDSTSSVPLLSRSFMSNLVGTQIVGFLTHRLIHMVNIIWIILYIIYIDN